LNDAVKIFNKTEIDFDNNEQFAFYVCLTTGFSLILNVIILLNFSEPIWISKIKLF